MSFYKPKIKNNLHIKPQIEVFKIRHSQMRVPFILTAAPDQLRE